MIIHKALLSLGFCVIFLFWCLVGYAAKAADQQMEYSFTLNYNNYPKTNFSLPKEFSNHRITFIPNAKIETSFGDVKIAPKVSKLKNDNLEILIDEFYATSSLENFRILLGYNTVFWGKAEILNLVDVVNPRDYSYGLLHPEKMSRPMIELQTSFENVTASMFFLPKFIANKYPPNSSRESSLLAMNDAEIAFTNNKTKNSESVGIYIEGYFKDFDYGVSYFSGISNEAFFKPIGFQLEANYPTIKQLGFDIQYLLENTTFKAEYINRSGQYNITGQRVDYAAGILGLEHIFYSPLWLEGDLRTIVEYSFDDRQTLSHSGFENDLFLGLHYVFNDVWNSEIEALLTIDRNGKSSFFRGGFKRNLTDNLNVNIEWLSPNFAQTDEIFSDLNKEESLGVQLKYSF